MSKAEEHERAKWFVEALTSIGETVTVEDFLGTCSKCKDTDRLVATDLPFDDEVIFICEECRKNAG